MALNIEVSGMRAGLPTLAGLLLGLSACPAMADVPPAAATGPDAVARETNEEAMERARRQAIGPMLRIIQAARLNKATIKEEEPQRTVALAAPQRKKDVLRVPARTAQRDPEPEPLPSAPVAATGVSVAAMSPSANLASTADLPSPQPALAQQTWSAEAEFGQRVPVRFAPSNVAKMMPAVARLTVPAEPGPAFEAGKPQTSLSTPELAPKDAGSAAEIAAAPLSRLTDVPPEYRVKAALIYNFAALTQWPDAVGKEIQLCLVGSDLFGAEMDALHGKAAGSRKLAVHRRVGLADLASCNIVFVPADSVIPLANVREHLRRQAVLLVTEHRGALVEGATLNMRLVDHRVTFEASAAAAREAGLVLNSRLLALATDVTQ